MPWWLAIFVWVAWLAGIVVVAIVWLLVVLISWPFRVLLEKASPKPEAKFVIAHCEHGYTSDLSLAAMDDDDVLVAWGHGGEPLEPQHGFPLRLVVPKRYAWKSAKWLRGLQFTDTNERGFWEVRGYHVHADPWREERYSYQESTDSEREP